MRKITYLRNHRSHKLRGVIVVLFLCCICFVGCESVRNDNAYFLSAENRSAELEGGGKLTLTFFGDYSRLTLKNGDFESVIEGRYLADDDTLVIFDDTLKKSYTFNYVLHKDSLDMIYDGNTVHMLPDKQNVSRETQNKQ